MRIRRAVVGRSGTTFCVPTTSVRSTKSARRAFRAVGVARTCRIAGGGTADTVAVEIYATVLPEGEQAFFVAKVAKPTYMFTTRS